MSGSRSEQEGLREVLRRLQEAFDAVPSEIIEEWVRREHAALTGPIRDFVPVLVEKAVRDQLSALQRRAEVIMTPLNEAAGLGV